MLQSLVFIPLLLFEHFIIFFVSFLNLFHLDLRDRYKGKLITVGLTVE